MLRAGYLEDWVWNATLSGAPQGGVLSPCLSNIYLDRLDKFVETVLMPEYTRGVLRRRNPEYNRVQQRARSCPQTRRSCLGAGAAQAAAQPPEPGIRRILAIGGCVTCRYADDILLGFAGPKAEAEEIKRRLAQFLRDDLKLELSETKTLITHARTERGAVPRLRDHHPARQPDHHRWPSSGQRQDPAPRAQAT